MWEPLWHHLVAVGGLAAGFAAPFGAATIARAAGLLHDIGKCSAEFQAYMRGGGNRTDHSTAGAIEAVRLYRGGGQDEYARLIAFAIAGHHCGLADGVGAGTGATSLDGRLNKTVAPYPGWQVEAIGLPDALPPGPIVAPGRDRGYALAFLGRMLFSCLVDADCLATEKFFAAARGEDVARGGHASLDALRRRLDRHLATLLAHAGDTPLNRLRADILAHARGKAACDPGLFTMTVPTGGGKTLASLAFALDHAIRHGLDRVVYVIPYTSIIEQTADVFRRALGPDDVLEHHGNIDWERPRGGDVAAEDDEGRDGWRKLQRASENWHVPVVVTTAVQFFESLHGARTSRCRKLHNLARSVVILDEAQMLPLPLLRPCIAAIDELAANYGASIVLCTATQPALRRDQDGFRNGLVIPDDRELAPEPARLYEQLKRVTVEHLGVVTDAGIAARFGEIDQMLCIVNSRKHAQALFALIAHLPGARHLTTLMCPAHRRQVLAEVRAELSAGRPARIVSTSLIEAGVDIDLPEVWRAETGLDAIAQAAGRCNREGAATLGRVVVFVAADHDLPPQFQAQVDAARRPLARYADKLGLDAINMYFRRLYAIRGEDTQGALDAAKVHGQPGILRAIRDAEADLSFPYRSIADAFRMIDDRAEPVFVPWPSAADPAWLSVRDRVVREQPMSRDTRRAAEQFIVRIPPSARQRLTGIKLRPLKDLGDGILYVADGYDRHVGLRLDPFAFAAEDGIV